MRQPPQRITIEASHAGQRLDRFLTAQPGFGTRSQAQRRILQGQVRVDGTVVKSGAVLRAGQVVEIDHVADTQFTEAEAQDIPLNVLFEDTWILVIDKPAGLVVHPGPGNWQGTLVSALLHHWGGTPGDLDPLRPGIVHRLDKDTSGVLVIAKDAATHAALAAQFHDRQVDKRYVAFVWGNLALQRGTIREPIGRNPNQRKQMAVRRGGRPAETRFEVVERLSGVTMVRLFPRTGRTHQIRVHLTSIGHPIVGDAVYGHGRSRIHAEVISRQALHAERLTFRHPHSQVELAFAAPLPADMLQAA